MATYACISMYTCSHTQTNKLTHKQTNKLTHTNKQTNKLTHTNKQTNWHTRMVLQSTHKHMHTQMCTYTHARTHTHTHTHTHTMTYTCMPHAASRLDCHHFCGLRRVFLSSLALPCCDRGGWCSFHYQQLRPAREQAHRCWWTPSSTQPPGVYVRMWLCMYVRECVCVCESVWVSV